MIEHILSNCHGERDALLMSFPAVAYVLMFWRAKRAEKRRKP